VGFTPLVSLLEDKPHKPGRAYFHMVLSILPAGFLDAPGPMDDYLTVAVAGLDKVETRWDIPRSDWPGVHSRLVGSGLWWLVIADIPLGGRPPR
jgi:hypothetical protein